MITPASSPIEDPPRAASLATWMRERSQTIKAVTIGSVTWPLAVIAMWTLWPTVAPHADRVGYALQLAAAPAILVMLMITACMRLFDTPGAENPLLGAESKRHKINSRVLANSLEQLVIFVVLLLALATRLPASQLVLLPVATALWCTGRVMFWIGYHIAPHWRAPGFDWTFYTTSLLAGWFIYTLV